MDIKTVKIAIAHDYLRTYGGGERVLEELHLMWPNAPIFVATFDKKRMGNFSEKFEGMDIRTSWVQRIPLLNKYPLFYRFLLPWVWSSFDTTQYDLVITSSGSNMAKSIKVTGKTKHVCYCHTPPRFLYDFPTESNILDNKFTQFIFSGLLKYLKRFDLLSSKNVDLFIANSKNVSRRIREIYKMKSIVIYPPCGDNKTFKKDNGKYFLVVSRLVRYKNIDLIIKAFGNLKFPLVIVGDGKDKAKLATIANEFSNVKFLGSVPDSQLKNIYARSRALIVATEDEDFGMTIPEAASYGKPSIAYYSGGLKETIINGKTGLFFYKMTTDGIENAVLNFQKTKFDSNFIQKYSYNFSTKTFKKNMIAAVKRL